MAADDVWLQRPSEAEVRQQKLEKARSSAARARSGQARASTSGRSKRTASVGHDTSHSAGRKRPRSASSSEEEPDDVLISPKTFQRVRIRSHVSMLTLELSVVLSSAIPVLCVFCVLVAFDC